MLAAAGLAQELPVSGDAHVNSLYPDVNFGALPFLQTGGTTRTFVKFNLSGFPPGASPSDVSRASLVLWVGRLATGGEVQVSEAGGQWDEATLTYTTAPASGAFIATFSVPQAAQFVTVDVTATVQKWLLSPQSNQGFVLSGAPLAPATVVFFDSKESVSTSHQPELDVSFRSSVGSPGRSRTTGPIRANRCDGFRGPNRRNRCCLYGSRSRRSNWSDWSRGCGIDCSWPNGSDWSRRRGIYCSRSNWSPRRGIDCSWPNWSDWSRGCGIYCSRSNWSDWSSGCGIDCSWPNWSDWSPRRGIDCSWPNWSDWSSGCGIDCSRSNWSRRSHGSNRSDRRGLYGSRPNWSCGPNWSGRPNRAK